MEAKHLLSIIMGSYTLSIITVFWSGVVPEKWQDWKLIHAVAGGLPVAIWAVLSLLG
tara:strand:+ start:1059 stop:1229 length:171 start_codon:yes stop_codon:yes gene_type:complete